MAFPQYYPQPTNQEWGKKFRRVPFLRRKEIRDVLALLEDNPGVQLIGWTHAGKTSFLRELQAWCLAQDFPTLPMYNMMDLFAVNEYNDVLLYSAQENILSDTKNGHQGIIMIDEGSFLITPQLNRPNPLMQPPPYGSDEYCHLLEGLKARLGTGTSIIRNTYWWASSARSRLEPAVKSLLKEMQRTYPERAAFYSGETPGSIEALLLKSEYASEILQRLSKVMETGTHRVVMVMHRPFGYVQKDHGVGIENTFEQQLMPDPGLGALFGSLVYPLTAEYQLPSTWPEKTARAYLRWHRGLKDETAIERIIRESEGSIIQLRELSGRHAFSEEEAVEYARVHLGIKDNGAARDFIREAKEKTVASLNSFAVLREV